MHVHALDFPQGQPAYPYRAITSPTGIRLLVIHPDDDPESVIGYSLLYETDYSKRGYAALSYVWGEPADHPPRIILDGIPFAVTPNLHVAQAIPPRHPPPRSLGRRHVYLS